MRFTFNRHTCYIITSILLIFIIVGKIGFANARSVYPRMEGITFSPSNNLAKLVPLTTTSETSSRILALSGKWQFVPETQSLSNDKFASSKDYSLELKPTKQLPNFSQNQWQDIKVPANWWLEDRNLSGVVWYRHQFKVTPELKGRLVKLIFEGVDYTADVWLNGKYLGFHEGYFQPFSFFIHEKLNLTRDNVLVVRVNSPIEPQITDWSLHKRLIKGVLSHHDARPGGAWSDRAQEQNTGGIWNSVYLQVSNKVALDRVSVTPEINFKTQQAVAKVDLDITYPDKTPEEVAVQLQLAPDNFAETSRKVITQQHQLQPGVNHLHFDIPQQNPRLWWTWEHGLPNLYQLQVNISQSGQLLDLAETKFGFRTIEYDRDAKVWKLNGRRMFIRGTNYIGSQWLSEMTPEKSGFDLALIKQANINAVRVHAHIANPSFYDLCDRIGILVWQDFPLQWGYREDREFVQQAIAQGKDMINLLYNHPAIMAWSLHNEPPWDAKWMKYLYQNYNPEQNKLLDAELFASLKNVDSTRYLHKASMVNEHPWWGWYSNSWRKYGEPTQEPLISEFGAQALPNLSSLRRIFQEDELYPDTEEEWAKWAYHNFQRKETFENAQIPMGKNVQEFIDNTQQYQAKLTKFAAESYRRQRYQPVSAIFQFMFVENWASVNWAIVDYWRNPKPGYEALKTAYQPVLPIISSARDSWELGEKINLDLAIINDLWQAFPDAQVSYTLQHKWQPFKTQESTIDLKPDSLTELTTINYQPWQVGKYELVAKVCDRDGNFLGQNVFEFTVQIPS